MITFFAFLYMSGMAYKRECRCGMCGICVAPEHVRTLVASEASSRFSSSARRRAAGSRSTEKPWANVSKRGQTSTNLTCNLGTCYSLTHEVDRSLATFRTPGLSGNVEASKPNPCSRCVVAAPHHLHPCCTKSVRRPLSEPGERMYNGRCGRESKNLWYCSRASRGCGAYVYICTFLITVLGTRSLHVTLHRDASRHATHSHTKWIDRWPLFVLPD